MTFTFTEQQIIRPTHIVSDSEVFIIDKDNPLTELPEHIQIASTRYTNRFHTYKNDYIIGQSIRLYGEYSQVEIDILNLFITNETTVYDIGGNIGYHSLALSQKARHVHSFEPNEKNLDLLVRNCGKQKNITIHACCVSDVETDMYISDYNLDEHGNYGECLLGETGQLCKSVILDNLQLPDPQVVKIDVEGHEIHVFNGMKNIITRSKPVILYESMHGSGFDKIYDLLHTELGYTIYWLPVMNYNPKNYRNNSTNVFGNGMVINCLAIPNTMEVQVNGLDKMVDRNDDFKKFIDRMNKRVQ